MMRSIFIYALVLAAAAFFLQWIEYQYLARFFAFEIYIVLIGIAFTALGLWLGRVLTPQSVSSEFSLNGAALKALNITKREHSVLEKLADGRSNKEIAVELHISPNTVKTHVSRLYEKLEVSQRIQAVQKAKELTAHSIGWFFGEIFRSFTKITRTGDGGENGFKSDQAT